MFWLGFIIGGVVTYGALALMAWSVRRLETLRVGHREKRRLTFHEEYSRFF